METMELVMVLRVSHVLVVECVVCKVLLLETLIECIPTVNIVALGYQ
jgi:hypothetical protein